MQLNIFRRRLSILGCCLMAIAGSCSSQAAITAPAEPATVAEARKVLDLATFPLVEGAEAPQRRRMAGLSYKAPGKVKNIFEFQRKQLTDKKWKELPDGYVSDEYASGTFLHDGFAISVSVSPSGQADTVNVSIFNHGNVPLDKLPVPSDAKPLFVGPASAMYVTEVSVEKTAETCRDLLAAKGWQPYGKEGDSLNFKQNAIRLTASIASAPAQGGKTMISYSTELMSVDLPAPTDTIDLQYADVTATLSFDTQTAMADVAKFYQKTLAKAGWESTIEKLIDIDSKKLMIFRNPEKDMLTLETYEVDGKNRVFLSHQSAAEIAELERRIKADAEAKKKQKEDK